MCPPVVEEEHEVEDEDEVLRELVELPQLYAQISFVFSLALIFSV